jgi:hypothetical protein
VILLLSAFQSGKRKKGFAAAVAGLGFVPQQKADVELLAQLQAIYAPAKVNKVTNIATRLVGDEHYYIFDCTYITPSTYSNQSSSSSATEFNNLAVLSPHLDLPPFVILSRTKAPGALAGIADNFFAMAAASAGLKEYREVPTIFQMNYMLFVNDDPRVKDAFTDTLLTQIGMMDGVIARGSGQCLVVNRFNLRMVGKWDSGKLSEQVSLARQMTDLLVK